MKQLLLIFCLLFTSVIFSKARIIAHRGASGYEPENTLRSFKRALDMGAAAIELDVHRCASGELVVMHDDTIDRTTNGKGSVSQLPWNILKTYDAGKGEHIPLLSEVFDLIGNYPGKKITNIELKGAYTAKPVADLINRYVHQKRLAYDNFIVSSFDHNALVEFHTYCPYVKIGALFEDDSIGAIGRSQRAHAAYAIMDYKTITRKFIHDAHKHGIQVFAYTVNSQSQAKKLQKLRIDGIITNYPDLFEKSFVSR